MLQLARDNAAARADSAALCGLQLEELPGADDKDADGWNRVTTLAATLTYRFDREAVEAVFA